LEELRVSLERIRTLLESLAMRGLRACGRDELAQIAAHAEHLDQTGAGCLAAALSDLHGRIERDERTSAQSLLEAQTNVRLLERLLTLRVVRQHYAVAIEALDLAEGRPQFGGDGDDETDNQADAE
jgi:hypothetical protein